MSLERPLGIEAKSMRSTLIIIALVFSFGVGDTKRENSGMSSEPSLKETTDWLLQNFAQVSHQEVETTIRFNPKKKPPKEVRRYSNRISEAIESAKFDRCGLTLTDRYINGDGDDGTLVRVTVYHIPLGRLTSATIKSSTNEPITSEDGSHTTTTMPVSRNELWIEGKADNAIGSDLYDNVASNDLTVSKIGKHRQENYAFFPIDDGLLAPRLVKALNHAIELCHADAKPEPF